MSARKDQKQFVLRMNPAKLEEVQVMADHYAGGNLTATILRYIDLGLRYDAEAIRRERDAFQGGDPSD